MLNDDLDTIQRRLERKEVELIQREASLSDHHPPQPPPLDQLRIMQQQLHEMVVEREKLKQEKRQLQVRVWILLRVFRAPSFVSLHNMSTIRQVFAKSSGVGCHALHLFRSSQERRVQGSLANPRQPPDVSHLYEAMLKGEIVTDLLKHIVQEKEVVPNVRDRASKHRSRSMSCRT